MKINYIYELATGCINECMGKPRWGKAELSRYMKASKDIIQYFEQSPLKIEPVTAYDLSCCCIRDISSWLKSKDMDWSMEGAIVKYRSNWEAHVLKQGYFRTDIFK